MLLPPCVITSSTCGSTFVWEELLALQIVGESQQLMLRALLTISRCGVAAKMSTSRCISSTSAEPRLPRLR